MGSQPRGNGFLRAIVKGLAAKLSYSRSPKLFSILLARQYRVNEELAKISPEVGF